MNCRGPGWPQGVLKLQGSRWQIPELGDSEESQTKERWPAAPGDGLIEFQWKTHPGHICRLERVGRTDSWKLLAVPSWTWRPVGNQLSLLWLTQRAWLTWPSLL